ncbi:MAG TPA: translocation/assembly module TamB domain-containing protein [Noviherbaspirillum sp.]|nr:translocation/assembly module TamB domain-containing protein [Noviherbaspirillum sp.]
MSVTPASITFAIARVLRRLLTRLALAIAVLAALGYVALYTEPGARLLWQIALRAAPVPLSGEFAGGTLRNGIRLRNLDYRDDRRIVHVDTLSASWNWSRAPLALAVDELRIGTLDLTQLAAPPTPATLPSQMTLPLPIAVRSATLHQLVLRRGEESVSVSDIRLDASSDGVRHALTLQHASTPYGIAQADLHLDGLPPFAVGGSASLAGNWHDERFRIDARLDGTLENLALQLAASGDKLNGNAHIDAAPFEPQPLRRAQLSLQHLNPQLFNSRAPRADLLLIADLRPVRDTAEPSPGSARLAVAGPVSLRNAQPGPIDAGLLPILAAGAQLRLEAQRQQISGLQLTLAGGARLQGEGMLAQDERRALAISGKLSGFNPAQLFAPRRTSRLRPATPVPEARINADFSVQGALLPEPSARLQFQAADSSYAGLPLRGAGRIDFNGMRQFSADARLAIAGNRLLLQGGFGAPGQHLKFDIDAPALDRLGFGLAGLLQVSGELGGTMQRPALEASLRGERLRYRQDSLARLAGHLRLQGVPGGMPEARMALELEAAGFAREDVSLSRLNAKVEGSYGSHLITLAADGQLRGRPVAVGLAAHGRVRAQPAGYAWDGVLDRLDSHGIARLSLAHPVSVGLAPGRLVLGPAQITLEQARLDLKSLRLENGAFASEGTLNGLDLGRLLALQGEITGKPVPFNTDLVLDGRWRLVPGDAGNGFIEFQRRGGDIRITNGSRETALGIERLQLRGELRGQALKLALQAAAARLGSMEGQAELAPQHGDGRLLPAPDSPFTARLEAHIPRLQSIAALAGPSIALAGSADIALNANGTLASPRITGDAVASGLALTFYDQGIRLHDGSARLRLDDGILEVRQLDLRGGDGTLHVSGRIPLADNGTSPSVSIIADRLQLLSKPTAQLTISGQADAVEAAGRVEIRGKVRADSARFQLPEKSAPVLDDDVLVTGGKARTPGAKAAGPYTPRVALAFDLGDDFRFNGAGADVRLGGTLSIESMPGQATQATGTVHVVEGSYETFGTRLDIERGTLNFHQSFSNPDLNILAMRRDKEVAAGVQVTGTPVRPRVQLVSEPEVPEEDKLSWLVFGRAGSSGDAGPAQAQAAAKEAALGLFNRLGGARIAKGFGLDQIAVGSSEYGLGAQQVVSLGKEISNRLYIGYEQSLAGAAGVLKLTWDWSRHWSVVVRGGTIGGLDLLYNKRFDAGDGAERR